MFPSQGNINLGAKPGQSFNHGAVFLGLEIHRMGAFAADQFVAAVEAGEWLQALAAALIERGDVQP